MAKGTTKTIDASPEKQFFISMLTKDIEVSAAIIDLVDNSLDAARDQRGGDSYVGLSVEITIGPTEFLIRDNCGGLPAEIARDYAFRFGRPAAFKGVPSSVGQFGVGMKRALFKLGENFEVSAVSSDSSFSMEVDVQAWANSPSKDWTFDFSDVDFEASNPPEDCFTRIRVWNLHGFVSADFDRDVVKTGIIRQIALRHQSALQREMQLSVNGQSITSAAPSLLASAVLKPISKSFVVPAGGGELNVKLVAGLAPRPVADQRSDGNAEEFNAASEAGWYVYCNDRLVLAADRTAATGWGSHAAAFHPQYRQFRGHVYLHADDASLLPWNTTKTSLDRDTEAFRAIQQQMFIVLREVQTAINRLKKESSYSDSDEAPTPLVAALESAEAVAIDDVEESGELVVPDATPAKPTPPTMTNVKYMVPVADMDMAKEALDENSASQVGRLTFEYFLASEVD